jgi:hypothetical protein
MVASSERIVPPFLSGSRRGRFLEAMSESPTSTAGTHSEQYSLEAKQWNMCRVSLYADMAISNNLPRPQSCGVRHIDIV